MHQLPIYSAGKKRMNGRCENDPIDQAVDVCESCYGEFCEGCLVKPKGRRHPVCTDCALIAAGVRNGERPERLGSKKSVKKRRADLRAQAPDQTKVFQYFDLGDTRRERGDAAGNGADEPAGRDDGGLVPDRAKDGDEGPGSASDPSDGTEEAVDAPNGPEPTTSAVAKLNRLRQDSEPAGAAGAVPDEVTPAPPPAPAPAAASPDAPPPPTPAPAAASVDAPLPPAPAPAAAQDDRDSQPPSSMSATTLGTAGRDQRRGERRVVGSGTRRPTSAAGQRRRRSDLSAMEGRRQSTTAPMVSEVHTIGGRRSTDVTAPQGTNRRRVKRPAARANAGRGIEEFDADETASPDDKPRHDTDAKGNWIPPILRGMAPDARDAKADLPQRRRTDGGPPSAS
jgi:hypothetical protein